MHVPVLIDAADLHSLSRKEDIVIIDARSGPNGRKDYEYQHLARAQHVDLDTRLSDIKADLADGGRHPLPSPKKFAGLLVELGIAAESHVIVYDDKYGANAAARFWWMLKSQGHDKVQVLNGGLPQAEAADYPMTSERIKPISTDPYPASPWKFPLAEINEVEMASKDENMLIIDVRATHRFNGESEPIDLIAGHIPGAINIPFTINLDEQGNFLSPGELKSIYDQLIEERLLENVIIHCGSGVTACHTILAMAHAQLETPKLYVGSWSEWSRNNKPVGTNLESG